MNHGGDLSEAIAHYGGALQDWLDLSTGINPKPWPVEPGLWTDALHRLPARADAEALVKVAREAYKVPQESAIVAGPGTQALIQWLPHLAPPGNVAILGPTYSEHARSWQRAGRTAFTITDIKALPKDVRHVIVVNPNNPDGRILDFMRLKQIADEMRSRGGWLIVDESFADIEPALGCTGLCVDLPVIVLRSFGKFFGLPGLRLGFLIAEPRIALSFQAALGPWAVSAPALLIGAAALKDDTWAEAARTDLKMMAQRLDALLEAAGFRLIGGLPLFRLVHHEDAKGLHDRLARKHIWCRRFDETPDRLRFGLPRDDKDLARLKEALLSP
jgi:cobalamin biosynthesis protein CobC